MFIWDEKEDVVYSLREKEYDLDVRLALRDYNGY